MASLLTRYFADPPGLPRELHRFYQLALYVYPVGFVFHHAFSFAFWALGLHQLGLFNMGSSGAWLLALLLHRRRMLYGFAPGTATLAAVGAPAKGALPGAPGAPGTLWASSPSVSLPFHGASPQLD
jgi:hypothetical protein